MKGVGMLVGNFELNPYEGRPIWAGPKLFLTPKRDHVKTQTTYISLISLKRGHWVFAWRRAKTGSRPARCPKM